jgi:hypothetical protein
VKRSNWSLRGGSLRGGRLGEVPICICPRDKRRGALTQKWPTLLSAPDISRFKNCKKRKSEALHFFVTPIQNVVDIKLITASPLTTVIQKEERCMVQLQHPIRSETQILEWLD